MTEQPWNDIIKGLKEICQSRILNSVKISFKNIGGIKIFSGKEKKKTQKTKNPEKIHCQKTHRGSSLADGKMTPYEYAKKRMNNNRTNRYKSKWILTT